MLGAGGKASVCFCAWEFLLLLSTPDTCLPLKAHLQVNFFFLASLSPISTVSESHLYLGRRSKCFILYCFQYILFLFGLYSIVFLNQKWSYL